MGLDQRGDIAVMQLVVYIPILVVSAILVLRHGFSKRAGWLFLLTLSILRIVGSAIHIASEQRSTPSVGLIAAYVTIEAAGLSPLLLATLGFLGTVSQDAFQDVPLVTRALRLMGLLSTVALALSIAGGVTVGSANTQADVNQGTTLRHVGAILFVVLYGLIFLAHGYFWLSFDKIMEHRRKLLMGISAALPFLFIRVIYAILASFSPVAIPNGSSPPRHNSLSKFSTQSGSWAIYLVMSVLMEIFTVFVYIGVGLSIRLQDDYPVDKQGVYAVSNDIEMTRNGYRR